MAGDPQHKLDKIKDLAGETFSVITTERLLEILKEIYVLAGGTPITDEGTE